MLVCSRPLIRARAGPLSACSRPVPASAAVSQPHSQLSAHASGHSATCRSRTRTYVRPPASPPTRAPQRVPRTRPRSVSALGARHGSSPSIAVAHMHSRGRPCCIPTHTCACTPPRVPRTHPCPQPQRSQPSAIHVRHHPPPSLEDASQPPRIRTYSPSPLELIAAQIRSLRLAPTTSFGVARDEPCTRRVLAAIHAASRPSLCALTAVSTPAALAFTIPSNAQRRTHPRADEAQSSSRPRAIPSQLPVLRRHQPTINVARVSSNPRSHSTGWKYVY